MENTPEPPKKEKVVPIIIREKEKWTQLNKEVNKQKMNFTKAKVVKSETQIEPATETDYRKIYKLLKKMKIQFHTFDLKSEKPLKIVIRSIPQKTEEEGIKSDLQSKRYPIKKITRMRNKYGSIPMVIVDIGREYKSIYNLKDCYGLIV